MLRGHGQASDNEACFCGYSAYYEAMSSLNYVVGLGNQTWVNSTQIAGSSLPSTFLRDLASGADSLDIVLVGDSNTGSASADMWGLHNGMQQALWERGYTMYGMPVCPIMTGLPSTGGGNPATISPDIWRGSMTMFSDSNGIYIDLRDGNTQGGSTPYAALSTSVTWTRYGSSTSTPNPSKESWGYLPSGTSIFGTDGINYRTNHPFASGGVTRYRVRYGKFFAGIGGFCPTIYNATDGFEHDNNARVFVTAAGTVNGIDLAAHDLQWTALANKSYRGGYAFVGPDGSNLNTRGPVALFMHSIYKPVKGWSVTSHGYQGGETSTQIAGKIDAVKNSSLQTNLRELRERQIAAGGSGRVLVVAQAGTNGNEEGPDWVAAMRKIWDAYKSAWSALGYPSHHLAILCWVSHPYTADDTSNGGDVANPRNVGNLGRMRAAARSMVIDDPTMTAIDVSKLLSFTQLDRGCLIGGANADPSLASTSVSYWQKTQNDAITTRAHLSGGIQWIDTAPNPDVYYYHKNDGYTQLCHLVVGTTMGRI